jgi:spore coat protein U-like protein
MKKIQKIAISFLGLAAFAGASLSAVGEARADDFIVSAEVVNSCLISAADLDFGQYDPAVTHAIAPLDVNSTISVTCTMGSNPKFALSNGANFAADERHLADGAEMLEYGLYTSALRGTPWIGSTTVDIPSALGTVETLTVYGRIPGGQNKPAGDYTDTVSATVTF